MSKGTSPPTHRPLQIILTILVVTGLIALWGGVALSSPPGGVDTITICHANDSDTNPYIINTPARSADAGGHAGHTGPIWHLGLKADHITWGDIIPPFDYAGGHFDGLNWGTIGQAFYAHDCELVLSATLVKTNNADGVGGYSHSETADTAGASVPFKGVITNTGDVALTIDSLTDAVGATAVPFSCSPAISDTVDVGASVTCLFTVAGYAPADGASKTNTLTLNAHEGSAATSENTHNTITVTGTSVVNTVVPPRPDLHLTVVKTNNADGVGGYSDTETSPGPGMDVDYRVVVTNTSTVAVALDGVADVLGAAASVPITCATALPATLAPGASATCDFTLTGSSPAYDGSVTDTATVSAHEVGYTDNTVSQHDTSTVNTGPAPVLPPDLSIDKSTTSGPVLPGASISYTLSVHNGGTGPATSVVVDDTVPANTTLTSISAPGWTCTGADVHCTLNSTLNAGSDASLTVTITLASGYAGASVSNTATVGPTDSTPDDNTDTVITNVIHTPDLSIVKSGPQGSLVAGDSVTYTLTVTNDGDAAASSVVVDDALPAHTTLSGISATSWTCTGDAVHCTLDSPLAAGTSAALTVTLALAADYAPDTVVNTATVGPTDATPDDNTSTVTTPVTHSPDLSIVKSGPASVNAGSNVTWTLTVTNDGDADATSVLVTDTLPSGVTNPVVTATGWTCSGTTDVSCALDTPLAPGSSASLTISVTVPTTYTAANVSNTGVVGPTDATPDDNTSTATTTVVQFSGGGGSVVVPEKPVVKPSAGGGELAFTGAPILGWAVEATALLVLGLSLILLSQAKSISWSRRRTIR
jgi:uncharacterized repeat protein (TIGR01451 family)